MNLIDASGFFKEKKFLVGMVMFDGFTLLDLVGPQTALGFHGEIKLIAKNREPVTTDGGIQVIPNCTFDDCPTNLDVLFVPGGVGVLNAMVDRELLSFVSDRGQRARYVTSVCTGSLIQGAAGLLVGYEATTHWAWHDVLASLGAKPVKKRIVSDRNRLSGGGVTAGIDFGLTLLALLRGKGAAETVQLMMEYDPGPPFDCGIPKKATKNSIDIANAVMNAPAECSLMISRQEKTGFLL
jgi:cyclohexyl-isocyanide hydratase